MNIYEDYGHFLIDNEKLFKTIQNNNSVLKGLIMPVYNVLNVIYGYYLDGDSIDSNYEEVFDIGYSYFSNAFFMMNDILEDSFNGDLTEFMKYALVIYYVIYSDDYQEYLRSYDLLTEERMDYFKELNIFIADTLHKKLPLNEDTRYILDEKLAKTFPDNDNFIPTHKVFVEIAELFEIYETK